MTLNAPARSSVTHSLRERSGTPFQIRAPLHRDWPGSRDHRGVAFCDARPKGPAPIGQTTNGVGREFLE